MKTFTEFLNESKAAMEKAEGSFYSGNITAEQINWLMGELYGKNATDVQLNKYMKISCDGDSCTLNGKELNIKDFTNIIKSKGESITNGTIIKFGKGIMMLKSNNKELYYFENIYSFEDNLMGFMQMHKVNDAVKIADNF